jgi:class 3 adenylate cyclase/pimeloyl-ACP methyl ester carboxylesterase
VPSSTRTRYAKAGEVDIAYQVLGDGPIDILLYTGAMIPIDCMDEEPSLARFQRRLASFARLIRFDKRGMGLSDRGSVPTCEQWVEDGVAVLDAVDSKRVAVLAPGGETSTGVMLAVSHPERVSNLVVANGFARLFWAPDYLDGVPDDLLSPDRLRLVLDPDSVEQGVDFLAEVAPSVVNDPTFRTWWDRAGNLAATPVMAQAIWSETFNADVRHLLPLIRVPTLILQRTEAIRVGVRRGRYLAEQIPGAKYVELPGADYLYWVGDTGPMLDEIEEFVTGIRGGSGSERILATVLFTDIVGSTDRAAQLGDGRWRDLLDRHDQTVRIQIERFRGREVKTVGDGFVATFDSPGRAIECALAIRETLKASDIEVRAGIHTGEMEIRGDDVAGMAVHIGARVAALAGPGEVLVSSTVPPLVAGSGIEFAERGEHDLKGVPGSWKLFAVSG